MRYGLLTAGLALLGACERDTPMTGYCDDSGCYTCMDTAHTQCWSLPHDACGASNQCSAGQVCTNIGCCNSCHADTDCRKGERCTTDAYCAPNDVQTTPISLPRSSEPSCTTDKQCAAGQLCNAGVCSASCSSSSQC